MKKKKKNSIKKKSKKSQKQLAKKLKTISKRKVIRKKHKSKLRLNLDPCNKCVVV